MFSLLFADPAPVVTRAPAPAGEAGLGRPAFFLFANLVSSLTRAAEGRPRVLASAKPAKLVRSLVFASRPQGGAAAVVGGEAAESGRFRPCPCRRFADAV